MNKERSLQDSIDTSVDLWRAFRSRAGLDLSKRMDGREAHDAALEAAVRSTLGLPTGIDLEHALSSSGVTTEALLNAILTEIMPWARMMRDILAMLEAAGGDSDSDTLSIRVQWDRLDQVLQESLRSFRDQVAIAQVAMTATAGRAWGLLVFTELIPNGDFRYKSPDPSFAAKVSSWARDHVSDDIRVWYDAYIKGSTESPPPISPSGDFRFDAAVSELRLAVISHLRALAFMGGGKREELTKLADDSHLPDGWTVNMVRFLHNDYLAVYPFVWYAAAHRLEGWPENREQLTKHLNVMLAQVPRQQNWSSAAQLLDSMLDLPIWKKRHELYSVWIATQIISASGRVPKWILTDGVLSFSFGGAKLVSFAMGGCKAVLWAEARERTGLSLRGHGRKNSVQPDYTVFLQPSIDRGSAGLVVECKHYRRAVKKSFEEAIADYAAVHASADVVLVNYTGVGNISMPRVGPSCFVDAFGEVRPGGSGLTKFREFVTHSFVRMDAVSEVFQPRTIIELAWEDGEDLDLHVVRKGKSERVGVSYASTGSLISDPWMKFEEDRRSGPGLEQVEIRQAGNDLFEVYVHRYSGKWPTSGCSVSLKSADKAEVFLAPAEHNGFDWWHVCDVRFDEWRTAEGRGMVIGPP